MALLATNRFAGDGATTSYEFNFVGKYIARSHVKVYQEDNVTKVRTPVAITDSNFLNDTTLLSLPVTPVGKTLVIYRETPKPPMVDFVNGARFTEYNMDLVARQGLFVAMEAMDAGDADAREQLLAAITSVAALVDDATAAVSDATAAALAAATSAANAATSESQARAAKVAAESANMAAQAAKTGAQTAQTGAETARTGAETARTDAQTAAGNSAASALASSNSATAAAGSATTANTRANAANTSATNAATSATNAATSASTASTHASNASTSANSASTSATNAANSATNAALASAMVTNVQGRMCCRVVVVDAPTRVVRLERCGGQSISINGVARIIPAAGVTLSVAGQPTPSFLYAGWNAGSIVLIEHATVPVFDSTLGQWIYPGIPEYVPVAYFRGDSLSQPNRFLRNYYNGGPATFTNSLTSDYTANWDGLDRQLATMPILLMPGDTIDITGQASIMSTPAGRAGDLTVKLGGGALARARNTHSGATFLWQNYHCSCVIQRGSGAADPAQEAVFELWYFPISATGNTFTVLGDGATSRIIVRVDPYKWA